MIELLKKIEYALRKDSLTDSERVAAARTVVCAAISKAKATPDAAQASGTARNTELADRLITLRSALNPAKHQFVWDQMTSIAEDVRRLPAAQGTWDSAIEAAAKRAEAEPHHENEHDAITISRCIALGIRALKGSVVSSTKCGCLACDMDGPHASSCAVHNGTALDVGPCDCGASSASTLSRPHRGGFE